VQFSLILPLQVVIEMQVTGMGLNKARPVLTLLVDDVVSFYEMFSYDAGINGMSKHAWLFSACNISILQAI